MIIIESKIESFCNIAGFCPIVNPQRIWLLCWWHYQLVGTFNSNERVNIKFKSVSSQPMWSFLLALFTPMKPKLESLGTFSLSLLLKHPPPFTSTDIGVARLEFLVLAYHSVITLPWKMWPFLYELRPLLYWRKKRDSCSNLQSQQDHILIINGWVNQVQCRLYKYKS